MIRSATLADLPAIVAVYNATIPSRASTADLVEVTVEQRRPWFDRHDASHPLWVLKGDDDVVLGWLGLQPFHERAAYARTAEVSVYVAPDDRRRGTGRALLAHAIARAPSLGLAVLLGKIYAHNAPSLALFERKGFARWGLLPGVCEVEGRLFDVVIVGRRVEPSPDERSAVG